MFTIRCYKNEDIICEITEREKEDALLYAEIMFNSGYTKVEVIDDNMQVIETF